MVFVGRKVVTAKNFKTADCGSCTSTTSRENRLCTAPVQPVLQTGKASPCLTLGMLFGEDEPGASDGQSDYLIPAQDLTRVGTPCWHLGDLFGERGIEGLELEDDPVIPAQDVGLDIFDDMPGFALAENQFMEQDDTPLVFTAQNPPRIPTTQDPSLATSASVMNGSPLRR